MKGPGGPSAIVIGAGVGGSSAALLLANAGVQVTLVEKNPRVGGSCSGYAKQGFHVDVGTHLFCRGRRGPLGEVLRRVGEPGAITFRRTRTMAEIRSLGKDRVLRTFPLPSQSWKLPGFLARLAWEIGMSPRDLREASRLFTWMLALPEAQVEDWDRRTVEELLAHFDLHEGVTGLLGLLLGLFFVVPYWQASAGEAIWCFRRLVLDNSLSYPLGGSMAVPGTYCRLATERGATILTGRGVDQILVDGAKAVGVRLDDGTELHADHIISTSSLRTTIGLTGAEHFPPDYVQQAHALLGSAIAVQAKIALPTRLVHAGAVVGGVGEHDDLLHLAPGRMREIFDDLEAGRVPQVVPIYCPVPTNFDPALAPEGHQLLTACAVAPTSNIALQDAAPAWEEAMLTAIDRLIPGALDQAIFVDCLSVGFIERWIGKRFGSAITTAQVPGQTGASRPDVETPLAGLYVAGCGAGARGVGTELAATSAMFVVDRILSRKAPSPSRRRYAQRLMRPLAVIGPR